MIISILTLFPDIFPKVLDSSIIGRAQKKRLVELRYIDLRRFAVDSYGTVDDRPYGGGVGMVMRVDVVARAITTSRITPSQKTGSERVILLDPAGKQFRQKAARRLTRLDHLILVCGHYEGIDARIHHFVDERLSIGPYVLTGGEIPAMVVADSVVRLLPGVLPEGATAYESHSQHYKQEPPHYTRPPEYEGLTVPGVLVSGNHKKIQSWKSSYSPKKK